MLNKSQITIDNHRLQSIQNSFALLTIIIPTLGFITAIGVLYFSGITVIEAVVTAIMYFLTFFGLTAGFHRYFSHRSFAAHPIIRLLLAILGSMAAQGTLTNWVADHRRHHQYSDQPEDRQTPHFCAGKKLTGLAQLWHGHVGWMLNSKITNATLFAKDILKDPVLMKVNQLYFLWIGLGLVIPAVIIGVATMSWIGFMRGFLWGGLVRIFLGHHSLWYIASFAHMVGHRDFETDDRSHNSIWMALFTLGESWHNNHHAFPNFAIFSFRWWQVDLAGWVIVLLEKLGLVWDVKYPVQQIIDIRRKSLN
jgi:stearoyl-CoA desaturase (Delta-9 desaturase)